MFSELIKIYRVNNYLKSMILVMQILRTYIAVRFHLMPVGSATQCESLKKEYSPLRLAIDSKGKNLLGLSKIGLLY